MTNEIKMFLPFIGWSGGPEEIRCPLVLDRDHKSLLSLHNGLTAFDGGLRIFGTKPGKLPTLQEWNEQKGWRSAYKELVKGTLVFFAEDVFGNQFAFDDGSVVYFDVEKGRATPFANSFSEWLSIVLEDPVDTLQLMLYRSWRDKGEGLEPSEHLCPVYPFIVKADPPLKELYRVNGMEDMAYKGNFAYQIKDVPDGAPIKMRVTE
jgi:Protein of unknown function DUF2625/SMI1 / KNR4 family (SUKH-1)